MDKRAMDRLLCNLLVIVAFALFVALCLSYSGYFSLAGPTSGIAARPIERLKSGPSVEDVLRKFGDDPEDIMAPDQK